MLTRVGLRIIPLHIVNLEQVDKYREYCGPV